MNHIIACVDGTTHSDGLCTAACWAAQQLEQPIVLLQAIEKSYTPVPEDYSGAIGLGARSSLLHEMIELDEARSKLALSLGKEVLTHSEQFLAQAGCRNVEKVQRHSGLAEAIHDLEQDAQLLVLGRPSNLSKRAFKAHGSQLEQIIRQVHTPVFLVNDTFQAPQSFMIAYDGRATADKAVQRIIESKLLRGLTCHLVAVKNNVAELEQKFQDTQAQLTQSGFQVHASLLEGRIADTLMQYTRDNNIGVMVMGCFSRSKLASVFLGSNTIKMIESSTIPLIIVR